MGFLLGAEFLALSWLGMYLGMRHRETPFWVMGGWFVGALVFALLFNPLYAVNAFVLA